jgi:hypothetical protein
MIASTNATLSPRRRRDGHVSLLLPPSSRDLHGTTLANEIQAAADRSGKGDQNPTVTLPQHRPVAYRGQLMPSTPSGSHP